MPTAYSFTDASNRLFRMQRREVATTPLVCINSNSQVTFHPTATFYSETGAAHPKMVFFATGGAASHIIKQLRSIDPPMPGLDPIMCSSANLSCQLPPAYLATIHAHQFLLVASHINARGHHEILAGYATHAIEQIPTSRALSFSEERDPDWLFFFATGNAAGRLIHLLNSRTPTPLGIRRLISTSPTLPCHFPAAFHAVDATHQFLLISGSHNATGHLLALSAWMDRPRAPAAPLTADRALTHRPAPTVRRATIGPIRRTFALPAAVRDDILGSQHLTRVRAPGSPTPLPRNRVHDSSTLPVARGSLAVNRASQPLASWTSDRAGESSTDSTMGHTSETTMGHETMMGHVSETTMGHVSETTMGHVSEETMEHASEPPVPTFTDIDAANQLVLLSRSDEAAGTLIALSRSGSSNPDVAITDSNNDRTEMD